VADALAGDGTALPWVDPAAFARRAVALARADLVSVNALPGRVFFDRGLIDAAVALEHADGIPLEQTVGAVRFHHTVFLAPPWPELFRPDAERRHGFDAASAEYDRLQVAYRKLGYRLAILPRISPAARADHILARLGAAAS
jgi:predicted ATPase